MGAERARQICTAKRSDGEPCRAYAVRGLKVCTKHGGKAKRAMAKRNAHVREVEMRHDATRLGVPIEIDPKEGILKLIAQKAGEIEWYRLQIADLNKDTDLVWGKTKQTRERDEHGEEKNAVTYEASINQWLKLKNEAEKDLARYADIALKYDIDERRIALAQESISQVEAVIRFILADARLGLTQNKQTLVPELMRDAVRTIVME